jgi:hypothetical protein
MKAPVNASAAGSEAADAQFEEGVRNETRTRSNVPNCGNFQAAKEGWLKLCAAYPNLSASDLAVAIAISTYVNSKSRRAWPSIKTLSADTNRNVSTVWRSLNRLEFHGLLNTTHGRGRNRSNQYRLQLGHADVNPRTLRRKSTPKGKILRTRNKNTAISQRNDCELAGRTSEEPQRKCREMLSERAEILEVRPGKNFR